VSFVHIAPSMALPPAVPGDLTLLYYTANRSDEGFCERVRHHLQFLAAPGVPIISISHKPLAFGQNICVGDIGVSAYNIYEQILIGARAARTPWVACVEDDPAYDPSHFALRPPRDMFGYDYSRWMLDEDGTYWWRTRTTMGMCIAARALMIETLEERFAKFPTRILDRQKLKGWGEPGRYEGNLGLRDRPMLIFGAQGPSVIFNHRPSLGGKRRRNAGDLVTHDLAPWGDGKALVAWFYEGKGASRD
jgi:hypothetical protein